MDGQAAQFGAQHLFGDGLAGVDAQAAAPAGLPRGAQAAQLLAQVIGRARDQGLERVHRGGARRARLGPGGEQDPQRLPGAIGSRLGQPFGRQGIARGPGRISRVRRTARPPAGALWPARLGDLLAVRVKVAGQPQP